MRLNAYWAQAHGAVAVLHFSGKSQGPFRDCAGEPDPSWSHANFHSICLDSSWKFWWKTLELCPETATSTKARAENWRFWSRVQDDPTSSSSERDPQKSRIYIYLHIFTSFWLNLLNLYDFMIFYDILCACIQSLWLSLHCQAPHPLKGPNGAGDSVPQSWRQGVERRGLNRTPRIRPFENGIKREYPLVNIQKTMENHHF